jgi:hypothetical protein
MHLEKHPEVEYAMLTWFDRLWCGVCNTPFVLKMVEKLDEPIKS